MGVLAHRGFCTTLSKREGSCEIQSSHEESSSALHAAFAEVFFSMGRMFRRFSFTSGCGTDWDVASA